MWWNNRIIQIIIAVLVICAVCWITKVGVNFNAGQSGIQAGITRG